MRLRYRKGEYGCKCPVQDCSLMSDGAVRGLLERALGHVKGLQSQMALN